MWEYNWNFISVYRDFLNPSTLIKIRVMVTNAEHKFKFKFKSLYSEYKFT